MVLTTVDVCGHGKKMKDSCRCSTTFADLLAFYDLDLSGLSSQQRMAFRTKS